MISVSQLVAVLAALPAALAAPAAGSPSDGLADLEGGTPAKAGSFPYIVSLTVKGVTVAAYCDGVLLNANTVITGASCSLDEKGKQAPANLFHVRAGSHDWTTGGLQVAVKSILVNPGFDVNVGNNDIALWQLASPIPASSTISYVKLPPAGFVPAVGSNVHIAGWGDMDFNSKNGEYPKMLQQAIVPVASNADCQTSYNTTKITANMFCTGSKTNKATGCDGDGGSPAVNPQTDVLYGIMSQYSDKAPSCGAPSLYNMYTRVSAYIDWINKNKF